MPPKTFNFQNQFSVGDTGEQMFVDFYKLRQARKSEGDRSYDILVDESSKVELKTDTYSMDATGNFFMERYGNDSNDKPGGPWRSLEHKIDFFVYFFITNKTFFWFKPGEICPVLDEFILDKKPKRINNKSWVTIGYTVPREMLDKYLIQKDTF